MINQIIRIWDNYRYAAEGEDGFQPTLNTYVLDGTKKRAAVLICPGGAYRFTSPSEGEPVALQFNTAGFHAFVLNYSVAPRKHPQPLLDASRAMCIIRENADQWRVDPEKIVICGFSAGGHLAAGLGVHWGKRYLRDVPGITAGLNRPNGLILCYPVISTGQFAHQDSFLNLLGNEPQNLLRQEMSLEHQVNQQTAPAFIWHTFNDPSVPVENALLFAGALRKHNIPFELHIYPDGPHGLALATAETAEDKAIHPHVASWIGLCIEWLDNF
jgi:acetyl esterase/lipase